MGSEWVGGARVVPKVSHLTLKKKKKLIGMLQLMWTINDFPIYANVSSWSTKGMLACPCCMYDTESRYLKHGHKVCYMRHR